MSVRTYFSVSGAMVEVVGGDPGPWVRHEDYAALDDLLDRTRWGLLGLRVGSCTCLTKTPDISLHARLCNYRRATEIYQMLENAGGVREPQGHGGLVLPVIPPPAPSPNDLAGGVRHPEGRGNDLASTSAGPDLEPPPAIPSPDLMRGKCPHCYDTGVLQRFPFIHPCRCPVGVAKNQPVVSCAHGTKP